MLHNGLPVTPTKVDPIISTRKASIVGGTGLLASGHGSGSRSWFPGSPFDGCGQFARTGFAPVELYEIQTCNRKVSPPLVTGFVELSLSLLQIGRNPPHGIVKLKKVSTTVQTIRPEFHFKELLCPFYLTGS